MPDSTLTRWSKRAKEVDEDHLVEERRGRKSKLDEEDKRLLRGFVFDRQCEFKKTTLRDVEKFCSEFLEAPVSQTLASNLMAELGFSSRTMQSKSSGFQIDVDGGIDLAYRWLKKYHHELRGSKVYSIDCVFTGHRTDTHKSFAVRGDAAPNFSAKISSFTACGITMVCSDGTYCPTILYTSNAIFDRARKQTARRIKQLAYIDKLLEKYKIEPWRIVYKGAPHGKKRKFVVPASAALVEEFLDKFDVDFDSIILSDGGNEFKKLGELGFRRHIRYDAAIHQWLSPNDNRLHGSGKKIWRELGIDYSDDPLALITFLWSLDEVMGNVSKWFNNNLQLDRLAPHVEAVADLIRGHNVEADGLYDECRWEYRFVAGLDPRGDSVSKMDGGLDGRFWNKK